MLCGASVVVLGDRFKCDSASVRGATVGEAGGDDGGGGCGGRRCVG